MHSIFNILRLSLLAVVAAWSLIVLGIALHFQTSFVSSDALMFVPLAAFTAIVTLLLFITLLTAPWISKVRLITQTRWELLWLGILAVFWLALGAVTANPDIADSEVECWTEEDGVVVDDDVEGYSNEVYHARYRVLQAFAFFNVVLLLGFFLFILALALWHHFRGRYIIWTTPTNVVGWFDGPSVGKYHLPRPVTEKRKRHDEKDGKYRELDDEKIFTSIPAINRNDSRKGKTGFESDLKPLALPLKAHTKGFSGDAAENKIWVPLPTTQRKPVLPLAVDRKPSVDRKNHPPPPPPPPIARKFSESRRNDTPAVAATHGAAPAAPERRPSQRERFDQARQEARRQRAAADVELEPRRQNSGRRALDNAASAPAPAIARKPSATTGRPRPDAMVLPDIAAVHPAEVRRHGSSSRPQLHQQSSAAPAVERHPTNPFARPPGRRV